MFIVFEGIDGSGKTTQLKKFALYLFEKNKHNHVVMTRNPYKDVNIREILTEDTDPMSRAEILAELFIKDRKFHAEEIILPCLQKNLIVISDRYKLSTIAYQSAQGLSIFELIDKHLELPIPDLTFIIDIPAEEASKRMKKDSYRNEHKFEKNLVFLEQARQNFLKAKTLLPQEKIFIINGSSSPEQIFEQVKKIYEAEEIKKAID